MMHNSTDTVDVAILCHFFYERLWDEIRSYIDKIECVKFIYFNVTNDKNVQKILAHYPTARVTLSENRGADIGGFLSSIKTWMDDGSPGELLIKCHTKNNDAWRSELFAPIFNNFDYVTSCFKRPQLGLVGSAKWMLCGSYNYCDEYCSRFGLKHGQNNFIGGTTFCGRSKIYKNFFSKHDPLAIKNELEPGKPGEPSKTHAWERLLGKYFIGNYEIMGLPAHQMSIDKSKIINMFDEEFYLELYPDVKKAVENGNLRSGYEHFLMHGKNEQRLFSKDIFDEEFYLKLYPDVIEQISIGAFHNAYHHFLTRGSSEGRKFSLKKRTANNDGKVFDDKFYLNSNPDVLESMQRGWPRSGYEHYLACGHKENRKTLWMEPEKPTQMTKKSKSESIAILCYYSAKNQAVLPKYIRVYLKELSNYFEDIEIVTNTSLISTVCSTTTYINDGLDFGMWKKRLSTLGDNYKKIALINDSSIVFNSLAHIFNWASKEKLDFWGITDSNEGIDDCEIRSSNKFQYWKNILQNPYHIQSNFLVFEKDAISPMLEFFNNYQIPHDNVRISTVIEGEINLSRIMIQNGLKVNSFMKVKDFSNNPRTNLHVHFWKELIERGLPIIKKKVITGDFARQVPSVDFTNWHKVVQANTDWDYSEIFG